MTTAFDDGFKIGRIMVPLDGAESSAAILPFVIGLARQVKTSVVLFRVASKEDADAAGEYLNQIAARWRQEGDSVTTVVGGGSPAPSIIAEASKYDDCMIAMTAHAGPGGRRDLIGSTAHRVLLDCVRPVLVLRPEDTSWKLPPAIVIGLDGSELATQALEPAAALARAFACEIVLVRSSPPPDPLAGAARYYGTVEQHSEKYLDATRANLEATGLVVTSRSGTGLAEKEIVGVADSRPASIIVLSTRGLTGKPNVLGSTTDRVVRSQTHPVMAVPAR